MRRIAAFVALTAMAFPLEAATPRRARALAPPAHSLQAPVPAGETDKTLHAMHDELARSMTRLEIPGMAKPFYIEYRLLDLDIKNVTASFGSLVGGGISRTRSMTVNVRVGDYHLDSSNFVSEDGFQGFLGQSGEVGIDRDYNSLRQDLWLATDQAYKAAITQMSLKQAFLRSLTKPPEIDDFSHAQPVVGIEPRMEPDWTSRDWEKEARQASQALRKFSEIYGTRVNYYLIYTTEYLMTSEGTTIRTSHSLAAVEAAMDTQAEDGMPLHDFYAVYVPRPADLPPAEVIADGLAKAGTQLMELRASPLVPDYTGPVLLDPHAAGSVLAQLLAPSLSGARQPLSMVPAFDQMLDRIGGRSEWTGRVGTRVFPATVSLVDDPTATEFQGQPLLGAYQIDDEGVKAQRVSLVENGILKDLLMSRRPGPDFTDSNGHGRSALLSDPRALASNLFLETSAPLAPDDMRKKFIDACKEDGHQWCLEIKRMDNAALSSLNSQDFSDYIGEIAGGISSGERLPLMIYRVYVADGREELVRGGTIEGLTLRTLRNMLAVGNDPGLFTYMQNSQNDFAGTALGAFGEAQGGIPSAIVTPSLLLDEVEIRGFHGEPRRVPIVPIPAMN
ncbi:MAG TPA: metallopeptidase TldD-related protein [Candidatus Cybelea sp.]|nr:metallopeptidase TldD-related protein [Candidatus Cybelea sp.]